MLTWTEKGERLDGEMHSINLFSDAYTRQFEALTGSWAILFVNQQNKRILRGRCAENPLVFPQSNDGSARDGRFRLSTNEELYATINATRARLPSNQAFEKKIEYTEYYAPTSDQRCALWNG
jgi:hypothetical protein